MSMKQQRHLTSLDLHTKLYKLINHRFFTSIISSNSILFMFTCRSATLNYSCLPAIVQPLSSFNRCFRANSYHTLHALLPAPTLDSHFQKIHDLQYKTFWKRCSKTIYRTIYVNIRHRKWCIFIDDMWAIHFN